MLFGKDGAPFALMNILGQRRTGGITTIGFDGLEIWKGNNRIGIILAERMETLRRCVLGSKAEITGLWGI